MRYFVDRDLGRKLGRSLSAIGIPAVSLNDRYPEADAEKVPDTRWIRDATKRGEVILTRDGDVHRRRSAELAAIVAAGGRAFVLETGNAKPVVYLRAFMIALPKIENIIANEDAPFVYGISRDGRLTRRYPLN